MKIKSIIKFSLLNFIVLICCCSAEAQWNSRSQFVLFSKDNLKFEWNYRKIGTCEGSNQAPSLTGKKTQKTTYDVYEITVTLTNNNNRNVKFVGESYISWNAGVGDGWGVCYGHDDTRLTLYKSYFKPFESARNTGSISIPAGSVPPTPGFRVQAYTILSN